EIASYRENLADSSGFLANILGRKGLMDEAREAMARYAALYEELHSQFPNVPKYRAFAAKRLTELASRLPGSQPNEAEKGYRQALQAWQKLVTDFPISPEYRSELAFAQFKLADLLWGPLKRPDEALDTYRQGINQRQQAAAYFEGQGAMRAALGKSYAQVAEVIARDPKRTQEAEDLRGRAETTFR